MASLTSCSPRSLLLLPHNSECASLTTLKATHGPGLIQVLRNVSSVFTKSTPAILDVAVVYNYVASSNDSKKSADYNSFQKSLGLLYRLICIICVEESIDIQYDNDVDVRVMLFDATASHTGDNNAFSQRPFIHFQLLLFHPHVWDRLYSLESENGETLLKAFLQLRNSVPGKVLEHPNIEKVAVGITIGSPGYNLPPNVMRREWKSHHSVAVGGTFDHLHAGHKLLLTITALLLEPDLGPALSGERVLTIGITADALLQKKHYLSEMQKWDARLTMVREFLSQTLQMIFPTDRVKTSRCTFNPASQARTTQDEFRSGLVVNYVEIFDVFGPTITEATITALVISGETRSGGQAVNNKREAQGWPLLEVFEVDVLDAASGNDDLTDQVIESYEGKISSTDIRRRLQDRDARQGGLFKG